MICIFFKDYKAAMRSRMFFSVLRLKLKGVKRQHHWRHKLSSKSFCFRKTQQYSTFLSSSRAKTDFLLIKTSYRLMQYFNSFLVHLPLEKHPTSEVLRKAVPVVSILMTFKSNRCLVMEPVDHLSASTRLTLISDV